MCTVLIHYAGTSIPTAFGRILLSGTSLRALLNALLVIFYFSLGAFAESRTATVSFVMSVFQSVRMEQLGYHWTDFH